MKIFLAIIFIIFSCNILSQTNTKAIKFIPQACLKIGSQNPAFGGQFDIVGGILFNDKYFAGIGSGYCTDMGMGGHTIPLYADSRIYFSTNPFLFKKKDEKNDFAAGIQLGMHINKNEPFKTGLLAACEFAYRFDFINIKQFKFPAFYAGLSVEYNYTGFEDEYRGYKIQDGYLKHIMLNIKVSFEIPVVKIQNTEK